MDPPIRTTSHPRVRWAIAVHFAAVWLCVFFAHLDRTRSLPREASPEGVVFGAAVLVSLLAWLVCPLIVLAATLKKCSWYLVSAFLVECALVYAQYFALLPTVQ